jgi:hypothetical protein
MPFQEVFELPSLNLDTILWNKLDTVVKVLKKINLRKWIWIFLSQKSFLEDTNAKTTKNPDLLCHTIHSSNSLIYLI